VNFAQGYLLGRPVPMGELESQTQSYVSPKQPKFYFMNKIAIGDGV
jgi:hypothetical protein